MPLTESLRLKLLWLFLAVSAFAAIEPSPYEAMFFICLVGFARGGLVFDAFLLPLVLILLMFDAAGVVALIPYTQESESVSFTFVTVYISFTTILFATITAGNPLERMKAVRSGYVFAGVVAAILGLLGYFNVAGLSPYFTLYDGGRAMGPFKDPNVFGPFLVAPIGWLCQDLLLKRGSVILRTLFLLILFLAVFLSFSRGALIDTIFTLLLVLGLTFLTTDSARLRGRVVMTAISGVVLIAALLTLALSVPSIREVAFERATLVEDYDAGEQGRFGNQLRSIPMLLDRPLGFGPYRFAKYFPADPHEVFLSAFASFGWVGGIAFAVFAALTLYIGCVFAFRRARVQTEFIGVFAAMLPQLLQGVQIDTIHWRHLFALIGCLYGLAAAAQRERRAESVGRPAPALRPAVATLP
jgi:hypothetical protein